MVMKTRPIPTAFGLRLARLRQDVELTQQDLAKRVGLSRTSVTNIEKGRQQVTLETLYRLAGALGKPPEELLPSRDEVRPGARSGSLHPEALKVSPELRKWLEKNVGDPAPEEE